MDAITSVTRATQAVSLAALTGAREIQPVPAVQSRRAGELMLQPDSYEPGTSEAPLPQVTYGARRSAYGAYGGQGA